MMNRRLASERHLFLLWIAGGILGALGIAFFAARLHSAAIAPIGLISLAIGVTLGAVLLWLGVRFNIEQEGRLMVGAMIVALIAVLAAHFWLYLEFRKEWHAAHARDPRVAIFRPVEPWSPVEYFRYELTPTNSALWLVDAVLIVGGTVGMVVLGGRYRRRRHQSEDSKASDR